MQVEVIQQHNDAPSAYLDFLAHRPEGFQHVCSWFDSRPAFEEGYGRLESAGLECIHEGKGRGVDIRFAYFRSPKDPFGPQFEIAEALVPFARGWSEHLKALAADWDGNDPIRTVDRIVPK